MPGEAQTGGVDSGARVHDSASVDPSAVIGEGVVVGARCVVGPGVVIGAGTELRAGSVVVRDTVLGEGNVLHSYAVLGDDPQDRAFDPARPGRLEIGDRNVFREYVTMHRSTEPGPATVIGSDNYFMACSHAGHNARVGDRNTMANGAVLAGHAHIGSDNVFSAYAAVHQFTTVGDLCMVQHSRGMSMHMPPFTVSGQTNAVTGLNRVGLRRNAEISEDDAAAVRRAFRAMYRSRGGRPMLEVVEEGLAAESSRAARRFYEFIRDRLEDEDERRRKRGVVGHSPYAGG